MMNAFNAFVMISASTPASSTARTRCSCVMSGGTSAIFSSFASSFSWASPGNAWPPAATFASTFSLSSPGEGIATAATCARIAAKLASTSGLTSSPSFFAASSRSCDGAPDSASAACFGFFCASSCTVACIFFTCDAPAFTRPPSSCMKAAALSSRSFFTRSISRWRSSCILRCSRIISTVLVTCSRILLLSVLILSVWLPKLSFSFSRHSSISFFSSSKLSGLAVRSFNILGVIAATAFCSLSIRSFASMSLRRFSSSWRLSSSSFLFRSASCCCCRTRACCAAACCISACWYSAMCCCCCCCC
mmetsp:Transcript_46204/g.128575  ORF Transcript_46204/g.128575 Transcript_46204/m.128575 type:complete len:305 (+) Transcript_46204:714-1628(+)